MDFLFLPHCLGQGRSKCLLSRMEKGSEEDGIYPSPLFI